VIKQRLPLADAQMIAVHYRVAVGTVHRWASEDGWRPYGTRQRRLWDLNEAQHSYKKRRPELDNPTTSSEDPD